MFLSTSPASGPLQSLNLLWCGRVLGRASWHERGENETKTGGKKIFQHLQRGANWTLTDVELTPFRRFIWQILAMLWRVLLEIVPRDGPDSKWHLIAFSGWWLVLNLPGRLQKKYARDHEIAALKMAQPDEGDPHAPANMAKSKEKILSVEKNDQNRTVKHKRTEDIDVKKRRINHWSTDPWRYSIFKRLYYKIFVKQISDIFGNGNKDLLFLVLPDRFQKTLLASRQWGAWRPDVFFPFQTSPIRCHRIWPSCCWDLLLGEDIIM